MADFCEPRWHNGTNVPADFAVVPIDADGEPLDDGGWTSCQLHLGASSDAQMERTPTAAALLVRRLNGGRASS